MIIDYQDLLFACGPGSHDAPFRART
jgi:hypothetical protein